MGVLEFKEITSMHPFLRTKFGGSLVHAAMRMFAIDKTNALYDRHSHLEGPAFAEDILQDLGVQHYLGFSHQTIHTDSDYAPLEDLRQYLPEGPFITISNHPYGSIDGIAIVDLIGHVRSDYKVIVNKVLSRVAALGPNFISVTPTGVERTAPTKDSIVGIRRAMEHLRNGDALGLFPAGAVSDLSLRDRCIRDREWQEAIIRLIQKAKVPIIPIRFFDRNSNFYYALGLINWRVRLLRLVPEVFNKQGHKMRIGMGPIISVEEQQQFLSSLNTRDPKVTTPAFSTFLRDSVYKMSLPKTFAPMKYPVEQ